MIVEVEERPLIRLVKILPDDDIELDVMTPVVAVDPAILLVSTLPETDTVFGIDRFVIVALLATKLVVFVVEAVIFVANRFVKYPVIAVKIFEKKFVEEAFVVLRFVIVEDEKVGAEDNVYSTCPLVVVETIRLLLVDDAKNE